MEEIKEAKQILHKSHITAEKIIRTWSKRDKNIRDGSFSMTDSRLIMYAMDLMFAFEKNINILTADYDLIDLFNNLFSCIIDKYVTCKILKDKCCNMQLQSDKKQEIFIPLQEFMDIMNDTMDKYNDKCCPFLTYSIWFYDDSTKKIYPYKKRFPKWLFDFALNYKGNLDCYAINKEIYEQYPIKFKWYSQFVDDKVRFEVWSRNMDNYKEVLKISSCKKLCIYELNELNALDPRTNFGGFSDDDEK